MFLAELLLRAVLEGRELFFDYANWFDMFLVNLGLNSKQLFVRLVGLVDMAVSAMDHAESALQRLLRALKARIGRGRGAEDISKA